MINNLTVNSFGSGRAIIDTGLVTNVDSVYLNYNLITDCVASNKNPFASLVNSTYACKCNECGGSGLKSKIVSIEITSDSIYNGIAANTPLNDIFKLKWYNNTVIPIDSFKHEMNETLARIFSMQLFTTTKPGNNKGHVFKLRILFTDGREVSVSSKRIYWI